MVAQLAQRVDRPEGHHLPLQHRLHLAGLDDVQIDLALARRDLTEQHLLGLGWEVGHRDEVIFLATQQVWLDNALQRGGTTDGNLVLQCVRIGIPTHPDWCGEFLLEYHQRAQSSGVDKVKQTPQFPQAVLDRRAGEDDAVESRQHLAGIGDLRRRVADLLPFVQTHRGPLQTDQVLAVLAQAFVGGDHDEATGVVLALELAQHTGNACNHSRIANI